MDSEGDNGYGMTAGKVCYEKREEMAESDDGSAAWIAWRPMEILVFWLWLRDMDAFGGITTALETRAEVELMMEFFSNTQRCKLHRSLWPPKDVCSLFRARSNREVESVVISCFAVGGGVGG